MWRKRNEKKFILILTTGIFFTFYGTGSAKNNPYADVPKGDWSYTAMANLIHDNLVRGVNDSSFDKNKIITRNDMAVLVAKAISKEDMVNLETKKVIDKLALEYAYELKIIGVTDDTEVSASPTAVPPKAENKFDRLSFHGTGRIRLDKGNTSGLTAQRGNTTGSYTPNSHINLDLFYKYQINDKWSVYGESEYGRQLNYGGENQNLQNSVFEQMYLSGPIADATIKAGRFSVYSPQGLIYDDKVSGAEVSFGNAVKTTIDIGKATSTDDDTSNVNIGSDTYTYHSQNYQSILFDIPLSKTTTSSIGYYHIGGNLLQHQNPNDYVNYYTVGINSKLADNLTLDTVYGKSNAKGYRNSNILSTATNSYLLKLKYKQAVFTKPKSFDIFAMYRRSPQLASYSNTDDWCQNVKGLRIGGDYIAASNIGLTAWYTFGKDIDTNQRNNMYRFECDFLI